MRCDLDAGDLLCARLAGDAEGDGVAVEVTVHRGVPQPTALEDRRHLRQPGGHER